MSALPIWLMDADDEEADDLASLGIETNLPMSESEIDATASDLMGRMAWYEEQIAQAAESERLEIERIHARYDRRIAPLKTRLGFYDEQVCILASRAEFGKKKSRAVGNGTYGKRETPESVKIVDDAKAVAWAKERNLGCAIKTTEKPVHKVIAPLVLAALHETGELPDGFSHESPKVTFFARPEAE